MKKLLLFAVLMGAVVGCDSATASEQGGVKAPQEARGDFLEEPLLTLSPIAVVSVRKVTTGYYAVRATVPSGQVALAVRTTNAAGFTTLSSGTEILHMDASGVVETEIQTTAGYRYLVIADPGESDQINLTTASYVEFVP